MAGVPPRTVAVVGVVGVAIGWLLASTIAPPVARLQSPPQERERASAPEEPSTERLRLALPRPPVEPARRRNPFVFADRPPAHERARGVVDDPAQRETEALEAESPRGAPASALTLAGIGVQGEAITAVLTDGTEVWIAGAGAVVRGHRVIDVTTEGVLLETPSGERVVLRLR